MRATVVLLVVGISGVAEAQGLPSEPRSPGEARTARAIAVLSNAIVDLELIVP
jgi:hypothetical protein